MRAVWVKSACALAMMAALCVTASSGTAGASSPSGTTLNIADEYGATWTCQFNPYNATTVPYSFGTVYEELAFEDPLKSTVVTPWLATKWTWSNTNKTLTFTIRSGVTWTSGKPFSAADVVFSFNLLKKYPALDLNSDWSVLNSVTQVGTDQVVFQFKTAAVPYFYYIASETPIVPEYIWSTIKSPATYLDHQPIGTGPYQVSRCDGNNIAYSANPHYWQAGLPKIKTVNFPAYLSNTPANADLESGKDQWGSQFIPSINKVYISKDPKYFHDWFEPVSNVGIFINLKNPVLSTLSVREAMAYAVDRQRVAQIGEYGEMSPANQTGIVTPTYSTWYDATLAKQYGNAYSYDPQKATAILEAAGYKKGSDGIMEKDGKKLAFTIINNSGYSDWISSVSIMRSELQAVGIQITPVNLSNTTYLADVYVGKFDLAYEQEAGGPNPYYELRQALFSPNSAPIGKNASTDWERYSNPATDALINQYATTTSTATQHQIVDQLEKVMLDDVPYIPVTGGPGWYQYDDQCIGGWVTPTNPYASPAQYNYPDWGVVLLHLYTKKSCM
jgi:peptide/nickel transport system substrate-binding protein